MLARGVLVAVLAWWGLQAGAAPVQVHFDWPAGRPSDTPSRIHIEALQMISAAHVGVPVEADAGLEGAVLDLAEGVWRVQASVPGYWSQESEVKVSRPAPVRLRLALWPAAILHGEMRTAGGEALPSSLDLRLSAIPAGGDEKAVPRESVQRPEPSPLQAELHCLIDAGAFRCLAPEGLFDVRLEAGGYAPRYAWSVALKGGESADLGSTVLRSGASVFGHALRRDGSEPVGPCQATLRADLVRRGGPEPEGPPQADTSFSVALNSRGYFQFVGVPPGRHLMAVECPAASGMRELRVQAESESRIDPPLLLEEQTLEFALTPQTDPEGKPWQITVEMTAPRLRRFADKAPAEGGWVRHGLMAGSYRVAVDSSNGTEWLSRDFDLAPGSGTMTLHLAAVKVAGRVLLSTLPVRARLLFFNNAGGEPVTLYSDDQGSFQGLLPITSGAKESSWMVEAHVAQPASTRRLEGVLVPTLAAGATASLQLVLPTIAVRGSVTSEEGEAQRGIQVTFEDAGGSRTTTSTDDTGMFQKPELAPGKYTAVAESFEGASDRTPFEVTESSESELRLILHPSLRVSFTVVSGQQPVADAAVQLWIAPGVPRAFKRSDQEGRFEVNMPSGTTEVGLTVGAPGYALKLLRMPLASESDPSAQGNAIELSVAGGTLTLNFQPPEGKIDRRATLYLVHNGAIQDARTLEGWGSDRVGASSDGPVEIESIEPGEYALCTLMDPAQAAALWMGALPAELCRKGVLEPGRKLTLSPQEPSRRADPPAL
jgi:hypothetical protein